MSSVHRRIARRACTWAATDTDVPATPHANGTRALSALAVTAPGSPREADVPSINDRHARRNPALIEIRAQERGTPAHRWVRAVSSVKLSLRRASLTSGLDSDKP